MCRIEACITRVRCKGLCAMHYRRFQRHGDPTVTLHVRGRSADQTPHGTPQGYNYHRCRCERCQEWRREYSRARRLTHPDEVPLASRKSMLKIQYGMTMQRYDEMLAAQGGVCAVCARPPAGQRDKYLHIDHDHETGAVRGLLCHLCNVGIGHLGDDPDRLFMAREYLMKYQNAVL